MLTPSPTQQPPQPSRPSAPEPKKISMTPIRRRPGQSPLAKFVKAIFRPIFKGLYYLFKGIRTYKTVALIAILLLLGSVVVTNYVTTGTWPFGIGNDQFNFHIRGSDGGGDHVKNWLYALRDGNGTTMSLIQSELVMSQPPDPTQLIAQYSQTKGNIKWNAITVMGVYSQADTTVDSFVNIDFSGQGPGGINKGVMIWKFTTLPQQQGRLLYISLVDIRPALQ